MEPSNKRLRPTAAGSRDTRPRVNRDVSHFDIFDMKSAHHRMTVALLVALTCGGANAQQYRYSQGYIFEQKYVQRIDLAKGEKLIGEAGGIERFRTYDWLDHGDKTLPAGVSRAGDRLVFTFKARPELSLRDYAGKGHGEGDWQRFTYLRSFAEYHLVGVCFQHDEPGFLLIEKSGAKVYFVDTR